VTVLGRVWLKFDVRGSDPDDSEARHGAVVVVLGNHWDAMGDRSCSNPRVVEGHPLAAVSQRQPQGSPSMRDAGIDRQGIKCLRAKQGGEPSRAGRPVCCREDAEAKLTNSDDGDGDALGWNREHGARLLDRDE
jgi:hypothetical protein